MVLPAVAHMKMKTQRSNKGKRGQASRERAGLPPEADGCADGRNAATAAASVAVSEAFGTASASLGSPAASAAITAVAEPEGTEASPRLVIIGCGNPNRRDDGAGPAVIAALRQLLGDQLPADVLLCDAGTDGMAVMFRARGCRSLVIIDAARNTGAEPGAIFEVPGEELQQPHPQDSLNLHDFRWQHALHAGRQIFDDTFPRHVRVFLVEAADTGFGLELSKSVQAAVDTLAQRLAREIALAAGGAGAARGVEQAAEANDLPVISLRDARLYLPAEICRAFFAGVGGVVLVRDGDDLCILPVRQAAGGGFLLKQRNAAGDCVVEALEFLRREGLEELRRSSSRAEWDDRNGALRLPDFLRAGEGAG